MNPSSVVVVAEVEEGVAIVAVDPEVTPGKDLEPDAGVPAELGGFHVRVVRSVEQLHLPSVPARAAQQEWRRPCRCPSAGAGTPESASR